MLAVHAKLRSFDRPEEDRGGQVGSRIAAWLE
jgi:hypothetical protein